LIHAPIFSSETYLITAIDLNTLTVQLSDSSYWSFSAKDKMTVADWKIGDLVMIGSNDPLLKMSLFDAILFNTCQMTILPFIEN
jgi:hypothetical protein